MREHRRGAREAVIDATKEFSELYQQAMAQEIQSNHRRNGGHVDHAERAVAHEV